MPVDSSDVRYFGNSVDIGFEGVVTIEVHRFKRLRGIALYLPIVLRSIFMVLKKAWSIIEYEDDSDGEIAWSQIRLDVLKADIYNGAQGDGEASQKILQSPLEPLLQGVLRCKSRPTP